MQITRHNFLKNICLYPSTVVTAVCKSYKLYFLQHLWAAAPVCESAVTTGTWKSTKSEPLISLQQRRGLHCQTRQTLKAPQRRVSSMSLHRTWRRTERMRPLVLMERYCVKSILDFVIVLKVKANIQFLNSILDLTCRLFLFFSTTTLQRIKCHLGNFVFFCVEQLTASNH